MGAESSTKRDTIAKLNSRGYPQNGGGGGAGWVPCCGAVPCVLCGLFLLLD